jgi:PRTRC genetic system ThiF family protein
MAIHHLVPELLTREVRVTVIGAGGSGSQMLMGLAQLHTAMLALGHPGGLDVTVIDADQVSEANVGRQMFYPSDVGLPRLRCSSIASTWRWAPAGRRRCGD